MKIKRDYLTHPDVIQLVNDHLVAMNEVSPLDSKHALGLSELKSENVYFCTMWNDKQLMGFGAVKHLSPSHLELKSMKTRDLFVRCGVASKLLLHLIAYAKENSYQQISLETGSQAYFKPAISVYENFGFISCAPFANYKLDKNSVFMTLML